MLENPDVIIVDIRNADGLKIKGAVQEDAGNMNSWMSKYPKDKTLIFYCA
jgi:rhodanese-related sulfurtransferase